MGRAALAVLPVLATMAWGMETMADLFDRIHGLTRRKAGDLDQIERTLTDGYAHALNLEAENVRLGRQIAEVTQGLQRGDTIRKARELSSLAQRLDGNTGDLERLRAALADLRRHADAVRVSA